MEITKPRSTERTLFTLPLVFALALPVALFPGPSFSGQPASTGSVYEDTLPVYEEDGHLRLPVGYEKWVLVGSSLGLGYSERTGGRELFHNTLLEPASYDYFRRTGEFRDGTMLALLLQDPGEGVSPQRQGQFASAVVAVELAVKNSRRVTEGWAYYDFGGGDDLQERASPAAADSCYSCHSQHAVHDNVFLQFYPRLASAAPEGSSFTTTAVRLAKEEAANDSPEAPKRVAIEPQLALRGLDPVLLTQGREEVGSEENFEAEGAHLYYFVNQENRKLFTLDPKRYGIQNDECPVVPGASTWPDLFSVYEGRIYTFASEGCIETFDADPESFLQPPSSGKVIGS